ncbi:olfactomedin-related [Holotrichia oblita]|uniref:Olfactomedin-related n=1 Tax=Holotrichia oblita TaxID=644536 RepID=A0ACB9TKQ6_HOLOL|nr:olfactomedin-related [Holotrichia oblita]
MENGLELKFKSSADGTVLSNVILPRSSTLCRTESRTKQYAFGVFTLGRNQKPLLFLSGSSESDTQSWMASIRRMLCVASYLPVGDSNFHVSIIDNAHSRKAGLLGLHGVLGMNSQDITISDPCTGEPKISWKWYQFHQFHLQAPCHPEDEKTICVMHTSAEFIAGPGQVYIYCKQSPKLLDYLLNRGKYPKSSPGLISSRRLSRSEGDLCDSLGKDVPDSPVCFRSNSGSEDSGVRVSMTSDDFVLKNKMGSSLTTLGMALLTKTPGGSETNGESLQDLSIISETHNILSRRESGISLASGIYEEILDVPQTNNEKGNNSEYAHHVYENPEDVIQKLAKNGKHIPPPPLPPRIYECNTIERDKISRDTSCTPMSTPYKHRCNTLPAKDLARISQIFTSESEYMIMTPTKQHILTEKIENHYMPMSPITNFKNKIENCYMAMSGKK